MTERLRSSIGPPVCRQRTGLSAGLDEYIIDVEPTVQEKLEPASTGSIDHRKPSNPGSTNFRSSVDSMTCKSLHEMGSAERIIAGGQNRIISLLVRASCLLGL